MTVPTKAEGRCICCNLPLSSCGKAIEEARREAERKAERRRTGQELEARYDGICVDCKCHYPEGTVIEWDRELAGWRTVAPCV